jgi:beta-galactosidase
VMDIDGMVSATDVYPGHIDEGNFHQLLMVNEITKALQNKQQALFSVEFQAGGNQDFGGGQTSLYDLHSRLCISSGMRAINHYLFCDGENDPILSPAKRHDWGHPVRKDGTLRKHYQRYPKLSKALAAYGSDLICSCPQTVTTIGFLLDYFMTEVNNPFTQAATNIITHQREVVLFDMIGRGLALTHRPFDAVEISRARLDVLQTPLLWVMLEKQCNADTQQKLVDYVRSGGKLILAGRMCVEDFFHAKCTILRDAFGITHVDGGQPFVWENINAFDYQDVPVSFVETYSGEFDEVFATRESGGVVGFVKTVGRGQVLMFGAAMPANTLGDLDIVHQMALKMDCPSLFQMDDWADVRISRGENGSFLFINNYQDDPVETIIERENEVMFGGNPVRLPARRGAILPVDWRLNENVTVHYVTSEIVELTDDGPTFTLKTDQKECTAEITFGSKRIKVHGKDGMIRIGKDNVS